MTPDQIIAAVVAKCGPVTDWNLAEPGELVAAWSAAIGPSDARLAESEAAREMLRKGLLAAWSVTDPSGELRAANLRADSYADRAAQLQRERDFARAGRDDAIKRAVRAERERDAARADADVARNDLTALLAGRDELARERNNARAEADTARDMREIAWAATANWRRHAVSAIRKHAELRAEVERLRGDLTARLDAAWVAATQPAVPVGDVAGAVARIRAAVDDLEARVGGAMPRKEQA